MSQASVWSIMKEVIYSMYDDNGNLRIEYVGYLRNKDLGVEREKFLQNFIYLLLKTDYVTIETKQYLKNRYIKMRDVHSELIENGVIDKKINLRATSNKIYYDQRKICNDFGDSDFISLIINTSKSISKYTEVLNGKICSIGNGDSLRENLVLNIPKNLINDTLDQVEFERLKDVLKQFTVKNIENVVNSIPKESIGYYNYLLNDINLSVSDKKNREQLVNLLCKG